MLFLATVVVKMFTTLRQFRLHEGVSQSFVAKKLGIHRVTYMNYELGRTKPPRSFYFQLAHEFRYPPEQILSIAEEHAVQ